MSGVSAASAVGFALICIFAGRLGIVARIDRQRWLSFAGGAATAYVFVHLLPELGAHRQTIDDSPFAHGAYLYPVVLAGTCIYYGLETYIAHSQTRRSAGFWVHMAGFSLYFVLIGYFLMHRGDTGVVQEVFYFTVLGLHIFALDTEFRHRHQALYDRIGRWVMAGSVLAGLGHQCDCRSAGHRIGNGVCLPCGRDDPQYLETGIAHERGGTVPAVCPGRGYLRCALVSRLGDFEHVDGLCGFLASGAAQDAHDRGDIGIIAAIADHDMILTGAHGVGGVEFHPAGLAGRTRPGPRHAWRPRPPASALPLGGMVRRKPET